MRRGGDRRPNVPRRGPLETNLWHALERFQIDVPSVSLCGLRGQEAAQSETEESAPNTGM